MVGLDGENLIPWDPQKNTSKICPQGGWKKIIIFPNGSLMVMIYHRIQIRKKSPKKQTKGDDWSWNTLEGLLSFG